jgi:hypothetical protein
MRTASSIKNISFRDRLLEACAIARMHINGRIRPVDLEGFDAFVDEYREQTQRHLGKELSDLKIVEVGFGARPRRTSWLYSMGCNVFGIDLEAPLLRLQVSQLVRVYKTNGLERALKSAGRQLITGQKNWRDLAAYFHRLHPGRDFQIPKDRLIVGDAAEAATWRGLEKVDLVYSEDVFEHIPIDVIPRVLKQMSCAMTPSGIALIRLTYIQVLPGVITSSGIITH